MSKVVIDMNEFTHLKGESVYNYNFYKHNKYGYVLLQVCEEEFETLHFYKLDDQNNKVILFSCYCDSSVGDVYEGDLGFYWS